SAFVVNFGQYGDVSQFAREQGASRPWVYRQAQLVAATLEGTPTRQAIERLEAEVAQLRQQVEQLHRQVAQPVVLDDDKQTEFASVGQGAGVTLSPCHLLLGVLRPGQVLSVASLGRRTQAVGEKSGRLLGIFDEYARRLVRDGAGDEIYVSAP